MIIITIKYYKTMESMKNHEDSLELLSALSVSP